MIANLLIYFSEKSVHLVAYNADRRSKEVDADDLDEGHAWLRSSLIICNR